MIPIRNQINGSEKYNNQSKMLDCFEHFIDLFLHILFILISDVHHQFDGVVRRKVVKEKNVISYVSGFFWKNNEEYQKLLRKDVSLSFETFLPEWKTVCNGGINGKQLIDRVRDVNLCLKMNYWIREKLWPIFQDYERYTEQVSISQLLHLNLQLRFH